MKIWPLMILAFALVFTPVSIENAHAKKAKVEKTVTKKKQKNKSSSAKSKKNKAKTAGKKKKRAATAAAAGAASYAASSPKYAEFVVDSETGRIIHQDHANDRRYPASLTKMMTIYLTFEQLKAGHMRLNQRLDVTPYAASMPKTNLSLYPGQYITVRDALLGLIVHSANDASVVLAENIAGSEDRFAELMTKRARQLGMKNTTFKNANGLHNPGQVTTAKDMALLAIALKKHYADYYHMFSRTYFTFDGRTYNSHNRVTRDYVGADGLKTGYVRASGFNLVTTANRDEGSLVGVVLGGRSAATRDTRMKEMLDESFEKMGEMKRGGKYQVNNNNIMPEMDENKPEAVGKQVAMSIETQTDGGGSFTPYPKAKPGRVAGLD